MKTLCKYCFRELVWDNGWATCAKNPKGYWYLCDEREYFILPNMHLPMNNLDYVEHLAKKRKLVL